MVEARIERRLAAILAADVAGYSRLMGTDEEGTLRQLKAHRKELVDPKITEHRGRIVKTTGDGMLVEFVSIVDAVRCAVDTGDLPLAASIFGEATVVLLGKTVAYQEVPGVGHMAPLGSGFVASLPLRLPCRTSRPWRSESSRHHQISGA